jgi:hypothetical protein
MYDILTFLEGELIFTFIDSGNPFFAAMLLHQTIVIRAVLTANFFHEPGILKTSKVYANEEEDNDLAHTHPLNADSCVMTHGGDSF